MQSLKYIIEVFLSSSNVDVIHTEQKISGDRPLGFGYHQSFMPRSSLQKRLRFLRAKTSENCGRYEIHIQESLIRRIAKRGKIVFFSAKSILNRVKLLGLSGCLSPIKLRVTLLAKSSLKRGRRERGFFCRNSALGRSRFGIPFLGNVELVGRKQKLFFSEIHQWSRIATHQTPVRPTSKLIINFRLRFFIICYAPSEPIITSRETLAILDFFLLKVYRPKCEKRRAHFFKKKITSLVTTISLSERGDRR